MNQPETQIEAGQGHLAIQAFKDGLMSPSLPSVVGSLLVASLMFVACFFFYTEEQVSRLDPARIMTGKNDWDAYTTVAALKLKYHPPPRTAIVFLGDSLILESFTDRQDFQQDLDDAGLDAELRLLATDAQSLWESAMLCDQLPDDLDVIVVLGISPLQMVHDQSNLAKLVDKPRMALDSPFMHEECRRAGLWPRQTKSYFFNHCGFFATRIVAFERLINGGVEPMVHYFTSTEPKWDEEKWSEMVPAITERLDRPENVPAMFELLGRLVERLVNRDGVRVVLVDMPRHPRTRALLEEVESVYRRQLAELAARYSPRKLVVWNPADEIEFETGDFHDFAHLSTDTARKRYQLALSDRLARWFQRSVGVDHGE